MSNDVVILERNGPIAMLRLNRPEAMNALGAPGDGATFASACEELNGDHKLRCIILTGNGCAFSSGGDLKAMHHRTGSFGGSGLEIRQGYRTNIHRIVASLYALELPVIAAVNGAAIGLGCDIACLADIRIASTQARFGATFLKIGLVPGDGGAWLLPRVVGMSRAAELLFGGQMIDAITAQRWGLVSEVVADDGLLAAAQARAEQIATQPPHALRLAKQLLRFGNSASFSDVMEMSAGYQALLHQSADHAEGVMAMLERRPASFTGE